jgi:hypothetical protein
MDAPTFMRPGPRRCACPASLNIHDKSTQKQIYGRLNIHAAWPARRWRVAPAWIPRSWHPAQRYIRSTFMRSGCAGVCSQPEIHAVGPQRKNMRTLNIHAVMPGAACSVASPRGRPLQQKIWDAPTFMRPACGAARVSQPESHAVGLQRKG